MTMTTETPREHLDTLIARRGNLRADLEALEKHGADGLEIVAAAEGDMDGTRVNICPELRETVWRCSCADLREQLALVERDIHHATRPRKQAPRSAIAVAIVGAS